MKPRRDSMKNQFYVTVDGSLEDFIHFHCKEKGTFASPAALVREGLRLLINDMTIGKEA